MEPQSDSLKRKRSPSASFGVGTPNAFHTPPAKAVKAGNQLSINYLARQSQEDLPLINKDDTLPNLVELLALYTNVLDRHESLASNLGARPLGPILIKRFERCFDAPPKIITLHSKIGASGSADDNSHQITWLEVIEFARAHPSQFTLSAFSEGSRVCQFYYPQKQLRVQVSEEDFIFIKSGRCQELIPPLPIWEDEEKEFNTCDLLEMRLKELTNAADLVAARTRQLAHRLSRRRAAIAERRAEGGSGTPARANAPQTTTAPPPPPPSAGSGIVGGHPFGVAASPGMRDELLRHFESLPHNNQSPSGVHPRQHSAVAAHQSGSGPDERHSGHGTSRDVSLDRPSRESMTVGTPISRVQTSRQSFDGQTYSSHNNPPSVVQEGPSSASSRLEKDGAAGSLKHNFSRPLAPAIESSQPFRLHCQAHMDSLPRGHRVMPPCDRCRRLRMDCVKNLTSCAGCTRKHARCHWKEVTREELDGLEHILDYSEADLAGSPGRSRLEHANGQRSSSDGNYESREENYEESDDEESNPLEDLEALDHQEEGVGHSARSGAAIQAPRPASGAHSQPTEGPGPPRPSAVPENRSLPPIEDAAAAKAASSSVDRPAGQQSHGATGPRSLPPIATVAVGGPGTSRVDQPSGYQSRGAGSVADPVQRPDNTYQQPLRTPDFHAINGGAVNREESRTSIGMPGPSAPVTT